MIKTTEKLFLNSTFDRKIVSEKVKPGLMSKKLLIKFKNKALLIVTDQFPCCLGDYPGVGGGGGEASNYSTPALVQHWPTQASLMHQSR